MSNLFYEVWDDRKTNGCIVLFPYGEKAKQGLSDSAFQIRSIMGRNVNEIVKRHRELMYNYLPAKQEDNIKEVLEIL